MKKLWDKIWMHWCVSKVPWYRQTVKKIVCTKYTFQKNFWKMEDFSRYFGWNFGETTKECGHESFLMYVPQKITTNCTHTKNYKKYITQKNSANCTHTKYYKKYITLQTVTKKWKLTLYSLCNISTLFALTI